MENIIGVKFNDYLYQYRIVDCYVQLRRHPNRMSLGVVDKFVAAAALDLPLVICFR